MKQNQVLNRWPRRHRQTIEQFAGWPACSLRPGIRGYQPGVGSFTPQLTPREVGTIASVSIGIAKISGLPGVGFDELVKFPGDLYGIAFNVDADEIGVVLLGDCEHLNAGDEVEARAA